MPSDWSTPTWWCWVKNQDRQHQCLAISSNPAFKLSYTVSTGIYFYLKIKILFIFCLCLKLPCFWLSDWTVSIKIWSKNDCLLKTYQLSQLVTIKLQSNVMTDLILASSCPLLKSIFLFRHYYSIAINYRKNELEQRMLMNLNKKSWVDGLTLRDYQNHCR